MDATTISLIVLPFEILAINIPRKGVQDIHQINVVLGQSLNQPLSIKV